MWITEQRLADLTGLTRKALERKRQRGAIPESVWGLIDGILLMDGGRAWAGHGRISTKNLVTGGSWKAMKIIEFPGYGVGAPRVYLPVERVVRFHMIDFNGCYGTEIILPDGRYIRVSASPEQVKAAIEGGSVRYID